tara:strand:- start:3397 stop:3795 length:399 start_codon:yes stop_codon:yes gene_type:complete
MIYILYSFISENNHQKLLEDFLLKFSIDFQKKVIGFRRWQDAQLSLLGRILLYKGTEKFNKNYNNNIIKYSEYNKPYFEDGEMVVCVVTDVCAKGIDVPYMVKYDEGHGFGKEANRIELYKAMMGFLAENLK